MGEVRLKGKGGRTVSLPDYGRVRITADGPFRGLCGKVELVYYDRQHTGSSPDHLHIRLDDGRNVVASSNLVERLPAKEDKP